MPRDDLVYIAVVLDRSGSMESIRDDAIGGFNAFLQEQQEAPGDALFTLVQFDDEYIVVEDGAPIKDVKQLDRASYVPRGGTALYDAIGRTVNVMEAKIASMPEDARPSRMIVATLSDGHENRSQEFSKRNISDIIEQRSKEGWDFMFLSAGLDQMAEAHSLGVAKAMYATGQEGGRGLVGMSMGASNALREYRSGRASGDLAVGMSLESYVQTSGGIQHKVDDATSRLSSTADSAVVASTDVEDQEDVDSQV